MCKRFRVGQLPRLRGVFTQYPAYRRYASRWWMKNEFKDAKHRLHDLHIAEEEWERLLQSRCDWDDPEDVSHYRSTSRFQLRMDTLEKLVPSRVCPRCRHLKLKSRSWVLSKSRKAIICRSCFFRSFPVRNEVITMDVVLFPEIITRFSIDRKALLRARLRSGLSVREFARRAGWSEGYQRKLESSTSSVSEETAKTLLQVLREASVVTKDILS